jgi:uncharacterized membrane protein YkoI
MKRILPGLVGVVFAASVVAGGVVMAQPQEPPARSPNSLGADWRLQQDEVRQGVKQRKLVPLSQVIEMIRRRTPGRELDAGLEYQGDKPIYRVRWMTGDGRRVDYLIDAATGALLSGG